MAKIASGKSGSVTASSGWGASLPVASISDWEITEEFGENDLTTFGDAGVYAGANGISKKTGTFNMIADDTTALIDSSTPAALVLFITGSTRKYTGNAFLVNRGVSVNGQTGAPPMVKFSFTFTGAVTLA